MSKGIYAFSHSWLVAFVGGMLLSGGLAANPLIALVGYPAVEYFIGHGLTGYSAWIVGFAIVQFTVVGIRVARGR